MKALRVFMWVGPWIPVALLVVVLVEAHDDIRAGDASSAFVHGVIAGIVSSALILQVGRRRR